MLSEEETKQITDALDYLSIILFDYEYELEDDSIFDKDTTKDRIEKLEIVERTLDNLHTKYRHKDVAS